MERKLESPVFIWPWKGRQTDHKPADNIFISYCKGVSFHIYLWRPSMKPNNFLFKFSDPFWMLYLPDLPAAVDIATIPYFPHLASRAAFIFLCLSLILPVSLTTPFFLLLYGSFLSLGCLKMGVHLRASSLEVSSFIPFLFHTVSWL